MKFESALDKVTRLAELQSTEQTAPTAVLNRPGEMLNTENLALALAEANRSPRLCIYSPNVVAMLTYLKLTNPDLVISNVVSSHLEEIFARQYPTLWAEISTASAAKRREVWSKRKKQN
jgi:hypothetical protein